MDTPKTRQQRRAALESSKEGSMSSKKDGRPKAKMRKGPDGDQSSPVKGKMKQSNALPGKLATPDPVTKSSGKGAALNNPHGSREDSSQSGRVTLEGPIQLAANGSGRKATRAFTAKLSTVPDGSDHTAKNGTSTVTEKLVRKKKDFSEGGNGVQDSTSRKGVKSRRGGTSSKQIEPEVGRHAAPHDPPRLKKRNLLVGLGTVDPNLAQITGPTTRGMAKPSSDGDLIHSPVKKKRKGSKSFAKEHVPVSSQVDGVDSVAVVHTIPDCDLGAPNNLKAVHQQVLHRVAKSTPGANVQSEGQNLQAQNVSETPVGSSQPSNVMESEEPAGKTAAHLTRGMKSGTSGFARRVTGSKGLGKRSASERTKEILNAPAGDDLVSQVMTTKMKLRTRSGHHEVEKSEPPRKRSKKGQGQSKGSSKASLTAVGHVDVGSRDLGLNGSADGGPNTSLRDSSAEVNNQLNVTTVEDTIPPGRDGSAEAKTQLNATAVEDPTLPGRDGSTEVNNQLHSTAVADPGNAPDSHDRPQDREKHGSQPGDEREWRQSNGSSMCDLTGRSKVGISHVEGDPERNADVELLEASVQASEAAEGAVMKKKLRKASDAKISSGRVKYYKGGKSVRARRGYEVRKVRIKQCNNNARVDVRDSAVHEVPLGDTRSFHPNLAGEPPTLRSGIPLHGHIDGQEQEIDVQVVDDVGQKAEFKAKSLEVSGSTGNDDGCTNDARVDVGQKAEFKAKSLEVSGSTGNNDGCTNDARVDVGESEPPEISGGDVRSFHPILVGGRSQLGLSRPVEGQVDRQDHTVNVQVMDDSGKKVDLKDSSLDGLGLAGMDETNFDSQDEERTRDEGVSLKELNANSEPMDEQVLPGNVERDNPIPSDTVSDKDGIQYPVKRRRKRRDVRPEPKMTLRSQGVATAVNPNALLKKSSRKRSENVPTDRRVAPVSGEDLSTASISGLNLNVSAADSQRNVGNLGVNIEMDDQRGGDGEPAESVTEAALSTPAVSALDPNVPAVDSHRNVESLGTNLETDDQGGGDQEPADSPFKSTEDLSSAVCPPEPRGDFEDDSRNEGGDANNAQEAICSDLQSELGTSNAKCSFETSVEERGSGEEPTGGSPGAQEFFDNLHSVHKSAPDRGEGWTGKVTPETQKKDKAAVGLDAEVIPNDRSVPQAHGHRRVLADCVLTDGRPDSFIETIAATTAEQFSGPKSAPHVTESLVAKAAHDATNLAAQVQPLSSDGTAVSLEGPSPKRRKRVKKDYHASSAASTVVTRGRQKNFVTPSSSERPQALDGGGASTLTGNEVETQPINELEVTEVMGASRDEPGPKTLAILKCPQGDACAAHSQGVESNEVDVVRDLTIGDELKFSNEVLTMSEVIGTAVNETIHHPHSVGKSRGNVEGPANELGAGQMDECVPLAADTDAAAIAFVNLPENLADAESEPTPRDGGNEPSQVPVKGGDGESCRSALNGLAEIVQDTHLGQSRSHQRDVGEQLSTETSSPNAGKELESALLSGLDLPCGPILSDDPVQVLADDSLLNKISEAAPLHTNAFSAETNTDSSLFAVKSVMASEGVCVPDEIRNKDQLGPQTPLQFPEMSNESPVEKSDSVLSVLNNAGTAPNSEESAAGLGSRGGVPSSTVKGAQIIARTGEGFSTGSVIESVSLTSLVRPGDGHPSVEVASSSILNGAVSAVDQGTSTRESEFAAGVEESQRQDTGRANETTMLHLTPSAPKEQQSEAAALGDNSSYPEQIGKGHLNELPRSPLSLHTSDTTLEQPRVTSMPAVLEEVRMPVGRPSVQDLLRQAARRSPLPLTGKFGTDMRKGRYSKEQGVKYRSSSKVVPINEKLSSLQDVSCSDLLRSFHSSTNPRSVPELRNYGSRPERFRAELSPRETRESFSHGLTTPRSVLSPGLSSKDVELLAPGTDRVLACVNSSVLQRAVVDTIHMHGDTEKSVASDTVANEIVVGGASNVLRAGSEDLPANVPDAEPRAVVSDLPAVPPHVLISVVPCSEENTVTANNLGLTSSFAGNGPSIDGHIESHEEPVEKLPSVNVGQVCISTTEQCHPLPLEEHGLESNTRSQRQLVADGKTEVGICSQGIDTQSEAGAGQSEKENQPDRADMAPSAVGLESFGSKAASAYDEAALENNATVNTVHADPAAQLLEAEKSDSKALCLDVVNEVALSEGADGGDETGDLCLMLLMGIPHEAYEDDEVNDTESPRQPGPLHETCYGAAVESTQAGEVLSVTGPVQMRLSTQGIEHEDLQPEAMSVHARDQDTQKKSLAEIDGTLRSGATDSSQLSNAENEKRPHVVVGEAHVGEGYSDPCSSDVRVLMKDCRYDAEIKLQPEASNLLAAGPSIQGEAEGKACDKAQAECSTAQLQQPSAVDGEESFDPEAAIFRAEDAGFGESLSERMVEKSEVDAGFEMQSNSSKVSSQVNSTRLENAQGTRISQGCESQSTLEDSNVAGTSESLSTTFHTDVVNEGEHHSRGSGETERLMQALEQASGAPFTSGTGGQGADIVMQGNDTSLRNEDECPRGEDTALQGEDTALQGEDTALLGEDTALLGEDTTLHGKDTALHGEDTVLHGEDIALHGEDTALQGEGTALQGEDTAMQGEDTALQGEDSALQGEDSSLQSEGTGLQGDVNLRGEGTVLQGKNTDLQGDDTLLVSFAQQNLASDHLERIDLEPAEDVDGSPGALGRQKERSGDEMDVHDQNDDDEETLQSISGVKDLSLPKRRTQKNGTEVGKEHRVPVQRRAHDGRDGGGNFEDAALVYSRRKRFLLPSTAVESGGMRIRPRPLDPDLTISILVEGRDKDFQELDGGAFYRWLQLHQDPKSKGTTPDPCEPGLEGTGSNPDFRGLMVNKSTILVPSFRTLPDDQRAWGKYEGKGCQSAAQNGSEIAVFDQSGALAYSQYRKDSNVPLRHVLGDSFFTIPSVYDMDDEDEEWLKKYNEDLRKSGRDHCLTEDTFEQVLEYFEREIYRIGHKDRHRSVPVLRERLNVDEGSVKENAEVTRGDRHNMKDRPSACESSPQMEYSESLLRVENSRNSLSRHTSEDCCICNGGENSAINPVHRCRACNISVHRSCYGIYEADANGVEHTTESPIWCCKKCQAVLAGKILPDISCAICYKIGGAMKVTVDPAKWAHVACALYTNETFFKDPEAMEPIDGLLSVEVRMRKHRDLCILCGVREGSCVRCCSKGCRAHFHISCGVTQGASFELRHAKQLVVGVRSFCPLHASSGADRRVDETQFSQSTKDPDSAEEAPTAPLESSISSGLGQRSPDANPSPLHENQHTERPQSERRYTPALKSVVQQRRSVSVGAEQSSCQELYHQGELEIPSSGGGLKCRPLESNPMVQNGTAMLDEGPEEAIPNGDDKIACGQKHRFVSTVVNKVDHTRGIVDVPNGILPVNAEVQGNNCLLEETQDLSSALQVANFDEAIMLTNLLKINNLEGLLAPTEVMTDIYFFWQSKRVRTGGPILHELKQLEAAKVQGIFNKIVQTRGEHSSTTDHDSPARNISSRESRGPGRNPGLVKMLEVRQQLAVLRTIAENVIRREELKRDDQKLMYESAQQQLLLARGVSRSVQCYWCDKTQNLLSCSKCTKAFCFSCFKHRRGYGVKGWIAGSNLPNYICTFCDPGTRRGVCSSDNNDPYERSGPIPGEANSEARMTNRSETGAPNSEVIKSLTLTERLAYLKETLKRLDSPRNSYGPPSQTAATIPSQVPSRGVGNGRDTGGHVPSRFSALRHGDGVTGKNANNSGTFRAQVNSSEGTEDEVADEHATNGRKFKRKEKALKRHKRPDGEYDNTSVVRSTKRIRKLTKSSSYVYGSEGETTVSESEGIRMDKKTLKLSDLRDGTARECTNVKQIDAEQGSGKGRHPLKYGIKVSPTNGKLVLRRHSGNQQQ